MRCVQGDEARPCPFPRKGRAADAARIKTTITETRGSTRLCQIPI